MPKEPNVLSLNWPNAAHSNSVCSTVSNGFAQRQQLALSVRLTHFLYAPNKPWPVMNVFVYLSIRFSMLLIWAKHSFNCLNENSDIKKQLTVIRSLIGHVNHSNKQHFFSTSLKQETMTRFDSLYLMLNSIVQNEDIFSSIKDAELKSFSRTRFSINQRADRYLKTFLWPSCKII